MKISQIFPSKYITAADLQGRTITLTITTVTMEEMITHENKKATKPVAWFERTAKGFVMNLTNAKIVAALYGDETDGWTGKRISVYPTRVKAFGAMTDCIRVREEIPAQPKPPTQAAQAEETTGLDDDEDVVDYEEDNGTSRTVDASTGEITDGDAIPLEGDPRNTRPAPPNDGDALFTPEPRESPPHARLFGQLSSGFGPDADAVRPWLIEKWSRKVTPTNTRNSATELSDDEKDVLADYIKDHLAVVQRAWKNHQASTIQATA